MTMLSVVGLRLSSRGILCLVGAEFGVCDYLGGVHIRGEFCMELIWRIGSSHVLVQEC
jgi:hypothetical protein